MERTDFVYLAIVTWHDLSGFKFKNTEDESQETIWLVKCYYILGLLGLLRKLFQLVSSLQVKQRFKEGIYKLCIATISWRNSLDAWVGKWEKYNLLKLRFLCFIFSLGKCRTLLKKNECKTKGGFESDAQRVCGTRRSLKSSLAGTKRTRQVAINQQSYSEVCLNTSAAVYSSEFNQSKVIANVTIPLCALVFLLS